LQIAGSASIKPTYRSIAAGGNYHGKIPMNKFIDGVYVNASGTRTYKLYVAASDSGEAPPLFVMLHGCDQDAADFAVGTRMNELAEEC
jgi:poly(3-hydroxybutyrate) depolymerase